MSTDEDDALSWAGDESPDAAQRAPRGAERTPRRRRQDAADAAVENTGVRSGDDTADHTGRVVADGQTGSVALVLLGLLGGVHLLYAVGWVLALGPLATAFRPIDVLGGAMFSLGLVFAAASPVVWFLATFWFTRSRPAWQRVAALVVGAVLLVPWPFVVGVS